MSDATKRETDRFPKGYLRGFWAFNVVQFQGAFNDNVFRYLIVFLATAHFVSRGAAGSGEEISQTLNAVGTVALALPFIFFPGIFGAICDRFPKQRVMVFSKVLEVGIMAAGTLAFYLGSPSLLFVLLFLMGTQSALFGPAKYGILPESLPESRLSWANGHVQMFTMLAVIAGSLYAGTLYEQVEGRPYLAGLLLMTLSAFGAVVCLFVSKPKAANPAQRFVFNPWMGMGAHARTIWRDGWLRFAVIGYCYFWFIAAWMQQNILTYSQITLGLSERQSGFMLAYLSIGIGLGAVLAGYLSRKKIEMGLVPLALVGLTVVCGLLSWPGVISEDAQWLLLFLGFFAGMYDVPLAATIQQRAPETTKGGMLATVNMLTFLGIFLAGGLNMAMPAFGIGTHGVFLICAALSLGMGAITVAFFPLYILRSGLWILANTLFRIRVIGLNNIPDRGGALFVGNHTSLLDTLALLASTDRQLRFVISQEIYDRPWVKPFARFSGAIPVATSGSASKLVQSLQKATEALKAGEAVCIFSEGQITQTGQTLPFKKGFERIMRDVDVPVVPVYIDRLSGSISFVRDGKHRWKLPERLPYTIAVNYGTPMPFTTDALAVRNEVQVLGVEAYLQRKDSIPLLHRGFARVARKHPFRRAMADQYMPPLTYFKALAGSIAMARALNKRLGKEKMVGLLVPPSAGGALANIAVQMMGRIAVNLNYTASDSANRSAANQCGIRQVITSKRFLERLTVEVPGEPIYLEEVRESISHVGRIVALAMAALLPIRAIERLVGSQGGRKPDDLAAVIFSSGSSGEPKGVMLSHFNIMSNIDSSLQVFPYSMDDCVMGILPFFHSFGFTGTLWLPLTHGLSAAYHPNPLDAKVIGDLVQEHGATFLFATPTFLQTYIRRCLPEQFASLRYVITGAEKLSDRIRNAFKNKFGVEPLEGYGTTECSPIVSTNIPDLHSVGYFQRGTKHGSIGHPLPGIAVRIADPDTGERLYNGHAGLLQVRGPNIMRGYLGKPELTEEVLSDGWYDTGDVASIDEDGFITITDRLARFSKIAGEMVPHTKVEEVLHQLLNLTDQTLAVAGVPDESKGERLVVLHTLEDEAVEELLLHLQDCPELPNLWRPRKTSFYRIEQIPVLGTGKMDLQAIKQLARQLDCGE